MARNRKPDYVGDSLPAVTPIKPLDKTINRVVTLTQADYNALTIKDDATLYCIKV